MTPPLTPRLLAGRYELGPVLGRGGMAVVHRAVDRELGRDVAVKIAVDGATDERFVREAKKTAQIDHPAVVRVLDAGVSEGERFLVMELLAGETLAERLLREGGLPVDQAVGVAARVCEALAASHAVGIIHRDIKPANVFLAAGDGALAERVKVLDFGIAKAVDSATALTNEGELIGTAAYMAPEQIRGAKVDGRVDLYSLGIVLYRAVCGRLPFEGDNMAALIHSHLTVSPPPLSASRPELARLDAVLRRLLAKSPDDRPQDALAARADLLAALTPVSAPALDIPALDMPPESTGESLASAPALELEVDTSLGPAPPAAHDPRLFHPVPVRPEPRSVEPVHREGALGWLAGVSPSISKRVAGYSALIAVLHVVFFHVSLLLLGVLGVLFVAGVASYAMSPKTGLGQRNE